MAATREPALRIRLDPSTDAVVSKTGVHFIRGRDVFFLDAKAAKKLSEVYTEIVDRGFEHAVSAVLDLPVV